MARGLSFARTSPSLALKSSPATFEIVLTAPVAKLVAPLPMAETTLLAPWAKRLEIEIALEALANALRHRQTRAYDRGVHSSGFLILNNRPVVVLILTDGPD